MCCDCLLSNDFEGGETNFYRRTASPSDQHVASLPNSIPIDENDEHPGVRDLPNHEVDPREPYEAWLSITGGI